MTTLFMLSSVLLALSPTISAQSTPMYPSPTDIAGSGPRPPTLTASAPAGTWTPTASGSLPPPSLSGIGKQGQINSPTDFCIYMQPDPTTENLVDAEAVAVSYCFNPFNDTRPMPDNFIKTAHFRNTSVYSQVSGTYAWPYMNLNPYDCGGEYDNHGAQGVGNPVGAHYDGGDNWMEFIGGCDIPGEGTFCVRSCHGGSSYEYCKNTFDLMGCLWVMPGDYQEPGFTSCEADLDLPVGVYNSSYTFAQGQSFTPPPVTAPSSSRCSTVASPTASGVTYSWAQLGYLPTSAGASTSATATSSGSGSSSRTSSGAGATSSPTGAASSAKKVGVVGVVAGGLAAAMLA